MYVYKQTEPGLWTVGYYDPGEKWIPESDHTSPESAAERVHYLNGGALHSSATNALDWIQRGCAERAAHDLDEALAEYEHIKATTFVD